MRPRSVPGPGGSQLGPWTAHYCESCASRLDRELTRHLARLLAATLLGVLGATSAMLYFGARLLFLQLVVSALWALALPALAAFRRRSRARSEALFAEASGHLLAARQDFAELAGEVLSPVPGPRAQVRWHLAPAALALCWCLGVQLLGRSELRVLEAEQDLTLLVDHTFVGSVPASLDETPVTGLRLEVLAGRRHVQLVSRSGDVRAEAWVTVVPGRSYLFGHPPEGRCFYLEHRSYGRAQSTGGAEREPLPGTGPIWEFVDPVHFWFVPLPDAGPRWTSGGLQTALRALPCAPSQRQAP